MQYSELKTIVQNNKNQLTPAEVNRFQNLKACMRNVADEGGKMGGASNVLPEHIQNEINWLKSVADRFAEGK
jgi:hypothetical protein